MVTPFCFHIAYMLLIFQAVHRLEDNLPDNMTEIYDCSHLYPQLYIIVAKSLIITLIISHIIVNVNVLRYFFHIQSK